MVAGRANGVEAVAAQATREYDRALVDFNTAAAEGRLTDMLIQLDRMMHLWRILREM